MKKSFLLLIASLIIGSSFTILELKYPPGTKYIKQLGIYVDQSVISIADWKEFVAFVRVESGDSLADSYLPDSQVYIKFYGMNLYNKQNLGSMPIVGLNFAQMEAYCAFRTKAVAMKYPNKKKRYVYSIFDNQTEIFLNETKSKKVFQIHFSMTEVIKIEGETPIYRLPKDSMNMPFTFRCVARPE
jgi:hypothetical protein